MLTLEQKNKLIELAAKDEFATLRIGKYIYRYRNGRFEQAIAGRPAPWVTVEYL